MLNFRKYKILWSADREPKLGLILGALNGNHKTYNVYTGQKVRYLDLGT